MSGRGAVCVRVCREHESTGVCVYGQRSEALLLYLSCWNFFTAAMVSGGAFCVDAMVQGRGRNCSEVSQWVRASEVSHVPHKSSTGV